MSAGHGRPGPPRGQARNLSCRAGDVVGSGPATSSCCPEPGTNTAAQAGPDVGPGRRPQRPAGVALAPVAGQAGHRFVGSWTLPGAESESRTDSTRSTPAGGGGSLSHAATASHPVIVTVSLSVSHGPWRRAPMPTVPGVTARDSPSRTDSRHHGQGRHGGTVLSAEILNWKFKSSQQTLCHR